MPRNCLLSPPASAWRAAELLSQAVAEHNAGNRVAAASLFQAANLPEIGAWFRCVVGPHSAAIHGPKPTVRDPPVLQPKDRFKPRMPSAATKAGLLERDGFHCRFCGLPVIAKEIIVAIARCYPEEAPWTDIATQQHLMFQAANLQFDHVLPHARGGESVLENMVVTCAVCNYGRMSNTLAESDLSDPRSRAVQPSQWDGLSNFSTAD